MPLINRKREEKEKNKGLIYTVIPSNKTRSIDIKLRRKNKIEEEMKKEEEIKNEEENKETYNKEKENKEGEIKNKEELKNDYPENRIELLDHLVSFVETESELNYVLAGYFSKFLLLIIFYI